MSALLLRVALLALAATTIVFAALLARGTDDGYTVIVDLQNAAGLRKNSPVKIDGVTVGSVRKLSLAQDGSVRARLAIDKGSAPIGSGASAYVRAADLFGAKFVDITGGDLRRPAASGEEIPRSRTGAPVEIDDVLNALDPSTRARLRILINETGVAVAGRGRDFNALLAALPRSLEGVQQVVSDVASDNRALRALLAETDRASRTLAPQRRALGDTAASAAGALATTASRQRALRHTIARAPATVEQLRSSLRRLQTAVAPLGPTASQLRRTAAPLASLLRELPDVERAARSTLDTARAASGDLTRLARAGTPLVRRLGPTSRRLATFATSLAPVSTLLDEGTADLLGTLEGWARAIQLRDGPSHFFRGQLVLSPDLVTALVDSYIAPSTAKAKRRGTLAPRPPATVPSQRKPGSTGAIKPPLEPLPGIEAPLLPKVSEAVTDLLDYLLEP